MKQNRFKLWMQAVDNELLEEAQKPYRRKYTFIYRIGAVAACLVLVITAVTLTQRKKAESLQMPNPVTSASAEEIQHLGYSVPLPKDAENPSYYIIDMGKDSAKMAEVDFEQNGTEYSCRALKSDTVQDISGLNYEWAKSEDWSGEDISVQLRQSDDAAWVGWYAFGAGVQWCISGGNNALQLLDTAQTIVENLGYTMPLYPLESAEDAVADGGYAVAFSAADLKKTEDGYTLTAEIYDYDRYEMEEIDNLKQGDRIQICQQPVAIGSITREDGTVHINGGTEAGGVDLVEDDGIYRTNGSDGQPLYYDLGSLKLSLSKDCTFEDQADLQGESEGTVYEYPELPAAIEKSGEPFRAVDTVITVRMEQIVQIIRYRMS
ncbi:MAG: hypothetical protein KIG30_03280 [Eubacteriales bacterium]|nr:hypothetical protein [Eubacteriales bacterium]